VFASLNNRNKVTLGGLKLGTGVMAGDFTVVTGKVIRKVPYAGQLVTVHGETKGYGYFLLPTLPTGTEKVETTPKLSGKVVLEEMPQ